MELNKRYFMYEAYEEMLKTKKDNDYDKISPSVGAVLVRKGEIFAKAHRCQTRDGHHAEQTLLDDLNPSVVFDDDDMLFVTLEPCIPESRSEKEIACAKRIVDARIKHVYIGMLDPNPLIYNKGVTYLLEHGVTVAFFDEDIANKIKEENKVFIESFGKNSTKEYKKIEEQVMSNISLEAITFYCKKARIDISNGFGKFWDNMIAYSLIQIDGKKVNVKDDFYICFGNNPIKYCDGAEFRLEINYSKDNIRNNTGSNYEYTDTYRGPMVLCYETIKKWINEFILKIQIRGQETYHGLIVDEEALKEAVINAIVHRTYNQSGDFNYFIIEDKDVIVKNPALLTNDEFKLISSFEMESSPKNPRIARIFMDMNLMERHHYGMTTFKELAPQPLYNYTANFLSIIFPMGNANYLEAAKIAYNDDSLTKNDVEMLEYIKKNKSVSTAEISGIFELPYRTAMYRLKKLVNKELVEVDKTTKSTKGTRYKIK